LAQVSAQAPLASQMFEKQSLGAVQAWPVGLPQRPAMHTPAAH
jgi:hypothetical protein